MPATLEVEPTLTDRYQATLPETARRALRLSKRGMIHHTICPGGKVVLTVGDETGADVPVLGEFLGFLVRGMASHPQRLQAVNASFLKRLQSLTGGVEIDLDSALSPDHE